MIPVTLAKLDNYLGFVGSYDAVKWWKTQPLENIDYLTDAVWVYGQYHICLAKNINGTYSIFQSRDNGYSWNRVLTTNEVLKTALRIDYGLVLVASSGGWWRSGNSGTSWQKVSTQAPNCHTVKELTNERLVALDGRYIWWSNDAGTTWTRSNLWSNTNKQYGGYISTNYPTIDGGYYMVLVGYMNSSGKIEFMVSTDGGKNFYLAITRLSRQSDYIDIWFLKDVINALQSAGTITGIEMTHISKGTKVHQKPLGAFIPYFVIQVRLPTNILRHYYVYPYEQHNYTEYKIVAKFDALNTPMASLRSEEVQITGTSTIGNWVIFSGRSTSNTPMLVYSNDYGATWKSVDLSGVKVYEGPDLAQLSKISPLQEDHFIYLGYSTPWCLNYWKRYAEYDQRCQSYDMDFISRLKIATRRKELITDILAMKVYLKPIPFDVMTKKKRANLCSMDVVLLAKLSRYLPADILIRRLCEKRASLDVMLMKRCVHPVYLDTVILKDVMNEYPLDVLCMRVHEVGSRMKVRNMKTIDIEKPFRVTSVRRFKRQSVFDALILKHVNKPLKMDINFTREIETSYEMGMTVQENIVYDILTNIERYSPQFPAIGLGYKKRGYPIFDSRKETKE